MFNSRFESRCVKMMMKDFHLEIRIYTGEIVLEKFVVQYLIYSGRWSEVISSVLQNHLYHQIYTYLQQSSM